MVSRAGLAIFALEGRANAQIKASAAEELLCAVALWLGWYHSAIRNPY